VTTPLEEAQYLAQRARAMTDYKGERDPTASIPGPDRFGRFGLVHATRRNVVDPVVDEGVKFFLGRDLEQRRAAAADEARSAETLANYRAAMADAAAMSGAQRASSPMIFEPDVVEAAAPPGAELRRQAIEMARGGEQWARR